MNVSDPLNDPLNDPLDSPPSSEKNVILGFTDEPLKLNWTMRDSVPLLSIPNNSISFQNSSKVIMRITPEGRLEKGEGLSDDEVSVQLFEVCQKVFGGKLKDLEDRLARESARVDWLEDHALAQHSTYISISDLGSHYNGFPGSFRAAVDRAMDKKENPL